MAFRGVRRNLGLFFGLTSLLIGVPAALFALPSARTVINNGLRASFPAGPGDWVISGVAVIWWAVGSSILHGALTYALAAPAEKQASIVEALRVGVSRAPAMAGLGVVMIVATILGFVALIVPGFMVLTAWFVAPPALIIERIGIRAALKRSAALTKGSRWLVLLVAVLSSLISTRGSNQGSERTPASSPC